MKKYLLLIALNISLVSCGMSCPSNSDSRPPVYSCPTGCVWKSTIKKKTGNDWWFCDMYTSWSCYDTAGRDCQFGVDAGTSSSDGGTTGADGGNAGADGGVKGADGGALGADGGAK